MAIYRVVLNGSAHGQAIINNLYYRTGVGVDIDGLSIGGADTLAKCVKEQVWPKFKECVTTSYKLNTIDVYPFRDGTFDLLYQNPWTEQVLQNGERTANSDGPGNCVILKFNLEPTAILPNGIKPPKRGYIALGPINSEWLDDSGKIADTWLLRTDPILGNLCDALAANLESLLPPVVFYPIRVHTDRLIAGFKITSFADVNGCVPRQRASFRRSRMVEN